MSGAMPFYISLKLKMTTPPKGSPGTPYTGSKKWGPGRFEFLDAIHTHINIKLKMGIQKRTE